MERAIYERKLARARAEMAAVGITGWDTPPLRFRLARGLGLKPIPEPYLPIWRTYLAFLPWLLLQASILVLLVVWYDASLPVFGRPQAALLALLFVAVGLETYVERRRRAHYKLTPWEQL